MEFAVQKPRRRNCSDCRRHAMRMITDDRGNLVENVERAVNVGIFCPVEMPRNCAIYSFRQPCREWKPTHRPEEIVPLMNLDRVGTC